MYSCMRNWVALLCSRKKIAYWGNKTNKQKNNETKVEMETKQNKKRSDRINPGSYKVKAKAVA